MTEYKTVCYESRGPVALVTLNRPESLNAIDRAMRLELPAVLQRAANDRPARVVVLTGAGRAFSAGADLREDLQSLDMTRVLMEEYKPSFDAITGMGKPVISAIRGSASGIGLSLALVCDLAVMADDAFLLCPFSTINLIPDGGANFLLGRQLGYKRAFQMAIEAERLPAPQALELGLVNKVVAGESVLDTALEWAARLAERAPIAMRETKKILRFALENSYDATYALEASIQKQCFETEDFIEGRDAFIEKRRPAFKDR